MKGEKEKNKHCVTPLPCVTVHSASFVVDVVVVVVAIVVFPIKSRRCLPLIRHLAGIRAVADLISRLGGVAGVTGISRPDRFAVAAGRIVAGPRSLFRHVTLITRFLVRRRVLGAGLTRRRARRSSRDLAE